MEERPTGPAREPEQDGFYHDEYQDTQGTPHTLMLASATTTSCNTHIIRFRCSCGVRGYVLLQNGTCGGDHRPDDMAPADPYHRSLVLFDGVAPVRVDTEQVLACQRFLS